MCIKLMFGLSDVFVVAFIARNRINGVGSLFFRDRILRFGKNMPKYPKVFWDKEYQSVGSKSSLLLSFQLKMVKSSIYRATYVERSECAQWIICIIACHASKIAESLKSAGRRKLVSASVSVFLLPNILLEEIKRSFRWSDLDLSNKKRV